MLLRMCGLWCFPSVQGSRDCVVQLGTCLPVWASFGTYGSWCTLGPASMPSLAVLGLFALPSFRCLLQRA